MAEVKFYPATQGSDGAWRLRVVSSTKGVLGNRVEKTGFFKFDTEEEAQTALDTLEAGDVTVKLGAKQMNSDLYELEAVAAVPAGAIAH